jgi:hypothetical protein
MKIPAPSLAALLLLAPTAVAGGLQKSRVPDGARWLVHLDVEAMKRSKLYEVVHEASGESGTNEMDEGLEHVRMFAGLDPTMDFQSVTLFCSGATPETCVAVFSGNAKIDTALEKLRTLATYHTTPVGNRALHTWGDGHETWFAWVKRTEGSDERVVVASQDEDEVVREIGLREGNGETLASASRPSIVARPSSGSILFAAAGENLRELGDVHPVSAVAKLAQAIEVDVGEDHGDLRVHVGLDAHTAEDAQRIHQVLQGAVALVGLAGVEHEEMAAKLQPLVDAIRLGVSNTRVDADFRYGVQALFDSLKSLDDHHGRRAAGGDSGKKAHHGSRRHHDGEDKDE